MPGGSAALSAALGAAAGVLSATGASAALTLQHEGVGCVVADRHPRLEARIDPAAEVGRARVNFRAEKGAVWYAVDMTAEGGRFHAVLPRPLKTTARFTYQVIALDKGMAQVQTQEFHPLVASQGECDSSGMAVAPALGSARVVVIGPSGAAAPAGFAAAGVSVAAGTVTAAGGAAGAAAGSGGMPTGLIILGAGGAAAATTAVVVASRGDGGGDDAPLSGTWTGTDTFTTIAVGPGGTGPCVLISNQTWTITQTGTSLAIRVDASSSGQAPQPFCGAQPAFSATRNYNGTVGPDGVVTVPATNPNCTPYSGTPAGSRMTLTATCGPNSTDVVTLTKQ